MYRAPVKDLRFVLDELLGTEQLRACPEFSEYSSETADAVLGEAARFAEMVLEPLCKSGDREGAHWSPDGVTMPEGFKEAYQQFCDNGWPALRSKAEFGGQNVPSVLGTAVEELWAASNLAFKLCPMLTQGAIEAIQHFGTPQQKQLYLPKMVSGQWTGTMNLTEPQAGSDLAQVRTRATPTGPNYRIYGQKIFITYGEHDLAENIVHMVLARIDGAPPGVRGISLFIVPKFWVNADGSPGARNDVNCASIEHKLGIHASPTCVMMYGENEGALGLLVGEPNRGLEYMFVMMNAARLSVGLEGYAQGERAFQQAADWARTRVQGKPPVSLARIAGSASMGTSSSPAPIIGHPDVKRMLLGMKSTVEACRAMALYAAQQLDLGDAHPDDADARGCACTRRPAHSHRQGVLHRERHRDRVGRHPGARRHGLRRGNGRSADIPRRAHHLDLRRHHGNPVERSHRPQGRPGPRRGVAGISRGDAEVTRCAHADSCLGGAGSRRGHRCGRAVAQVDRCAARGTRHLAGSRHGRVGAVPATLWIHHRRLADGARRGRGR